MVYVEDTSSEPLPSSEGKQAVLPGATEIGCGYDVVKGHYASASSCKTQLFDFNGSGFKTTSFPWSAQYSLPNLVNTHPNISTLYYTTCGYTLHEVGKSLGSKTNIEGGYGCYAASLESEYNASSLTSFSNAYTRVQMNINLYKLTLSPLPILRANLKQKFRKDLASMHPHELFVTYGTHFVNSMQMGGRVVYSSIVNTSRFDYHNELKAVAETSFRALIEHQSTQVTEFMTDDITSFRKASSSKCMTVGGDPSCAGERIVGNFKAWLDSVHLFPEFIDYIDVDSIQPIWNLLQVNNAARIRELKDAYKDYMASQLPSYAIPTKHVLKYRWVDLRVQYTDRGSGANEAVTVFKPDVGGDWYYLGQTAIHGFPSSTVRKALIVSPLRGDVLVNVDRWERIWDDRGGRSSKYYTIWQGFAADPIGYKVLGDFFCGGVDDINPPPASSTIGLKAIRADLLKRASPGDRIWCDKGSGASMDGAIFSIECTDEGTLVPGLHVGSGDYSPPNTRELWVLNKELMIMDQ